ncbi:hypothetical protein PPSIR1_03253 [Plesiocystis pacifica SIR-1]|uniref:Uncharacterized protein n=1 Tax=Plesiocystis pacifica SIR-1 TaxID=391625 RepID=A6GJY0_9BACT|nr:hypothetical protein PPSIR1_03253 [Plesiocystis pacifica SIR-1]
MNRKASLGRLGRLSASGKSTTEAAGAPRSSTPSTRRSRASARAWGVSANSAARCSKWVRLWARAAARRSWDAGESSPRARKEARSCSAWATRAARLRPETSTGTSPSGASGAFASGASVSGVSGASPTITWALVPDMPKDETPA